MGQQVRGLSLGQLIEELAPYLIGWRGYFGFCQTPRVLTNLEAWIRRRLRMYLWRQWRNGHNRFKELRRRGVPKFNAAVAAGSSIQIMTQCSESRQIFPDGIFGMDGSRESSGSMRKLIKLAEGRTAQSSKGR